jgi:predicted RNase H-like HicB family nuclease
MAEITITEEDGWFVISDEESDVTTQGETKLEALLMLVDALAGYEDRDEDPLATALEVFVPDPDTEELYAELEDEEYEPPEVSDEQVSRQREATLWLGKSHKRTDYSDPHRFGMLRAFIFGNSYGMMTDHFADLVTNGYWDVFDAIATGTRSRDELAGQLDVDREFVDDAVTELKKGLSGKPATDRCTPHSASSGSPHISSTTRTSSTGRNITSTCSLGTSMRRNYRQPLRKASTWSVRERDTGGTTTPNHTNLTGPTRS